jgi:glycosyltransferase involved in cell wall biosynthesis
LSTHGLPSALGQIGVDIEVLVVDDGSTDESLEELARIDDPRLRVLRNERTPGICGARNTGISAARGEWLAFLDDDDLWSPNKLRAQLDLPGSAPWSFAAAIVVDASLSPLSALGLPNAGEIRERLKLGNVIPGGSSNVIARTELVRRLGGFDEELAASGDWGMWLRLAEDSDPAISREVLVATLDHAGRMFFGARPDFRSEAQRLFERYGGQTPRQERALLEWLASEHHRYGDYRRAAAIYLRVAYRYRSSGNLVAAAAALLGKRGIHVASALLRRVRGSSHITSGAPPVVAVPQWLDAYRVDADIGNLHHAATQPRVEDPRLQA